MTLEESRHSEWGWSGLHLLLALSIPFVLAFLLSCKRAKEEKADLGAEVNPQVIDEALTRAVAGRSIAGSHVGEFVSTVVLRRIENSDDVITMGGTSVAISDEDTARNRFTLMVNKSYRKDDGTFRNVASEDSLSEDGDPGSESVKMLGVSTNGLSTKALTAWAQAAGVRAMASSSQPQRTTYHRFVEGDEFIDPPAKAKARSNCGGIANCTVLMHYLRFDVVNWYADGSTQKLSLDFGFSLRTPFLPFGAGLDRFNGMMVVDCRSTYVQFQERNVYVRDCQQLDDVDK